MNQQQKIILNSVMSGKNTFITGFAGSGKSYLINAICENLNEKNIKYGLTAMTGCAALLINGSTLHSLLCIGLAKEEPFELYKKVKKFGKITFLKSLKVLIIDEVSMLSDVLFDKICNLFKILHGNDKGFGGIQIILVGDMSQLKPVSGNYCFKAVNWELCDINVNILTENMRVQNDIEFEELLKNIRWGKITKKDYALLESMKNTTFENDIVPTKLFSVNKDVDQINQYELSKFTDFYSYKIFFNPKKIKKSTDYTKANKINVLTICIGAQVMVTRNIDTLNGIVNGTRGVVVDFCDEYVTIKLVSGKLYDIFYFNVILEDDIDFKYIPLILSWAMSIHKCQGATLDAIEIDIGDTIFADGQVYVAISRAKNKKSVKIINLSKKSIKTSKEVIDFYNNF